MSPRHKPARSIPSTGVTTPLPQPPTRADALRELAGLVLLLLGVVGLVTVAFVVDWRLGTAVLSTAALLAGLRLTTNGV